MKSTLKVLAFVLATCLAGQSGATVLPSYVKQHYKQANGILVLNDRVKSIELENISYVLNNQVRQHQFKSWVGKFNLFKVDEYFDFILVQTLTAKVNGQPVSLCHNVRMEAYGHISVSDDGHGNITCEAVDNAIDM